MGRRGILAAAGAALAGIVAKQASEPVAAVTYVVLGGNGFTNVTTAQTVVRNNGDPAVIGNIAALVGIRSTNIVDYSAGDIGVYGVTNEPNGVGVRGTAQSATSATGVGVSGDSFGTYGVYGTSYIPGGCGVRGDCTGGYGVLGSVSDGYGVLGQAVTGYGLYGFSQQNHAIVGQTARPYFGGVTGYATLDQTVGIYGTTNGGGGNNANAFAGYMDGNFVVAHGVKSAAVPHPDGTHRLVYCVESPDAWFEDVGKGQLTNGKANVTLDPDFAAVVDTGDYHAFPVSHDPACKGLGVVARSATGFMVQELNGGASSGTFSWRVVAKRRDLKVQRLAKVDLPSKVNAALKPLDVPKPPAPPQDQVRKG
jgi:hypothetical protein